MNALNDAHNRELFKDIQALRKGHTSVLWAMIRGRGSEARIAMLLGWPPSLVKRALGNCSDAGMINQSEEKPDMWYFEKGHEDFDRWQEMKELCVLLELETIEAYPKSNIEPGYLSSAAKKRIDPDMIEKIKGDAPKYLLRPAQWRNLQAIREAFDIGQVFSTSDYQRARKTSNSQYSINELMGLTKLGMVVQVHRAGRGLWWQVTPEAFYYVHEPMTVAEVAARKRAIGSTPKAEGSTEDSYLGLLANSEAEGMTTKEIAEARGISRSAAHKGMSRLLEQGKVTSRFLSNGSTSWGLK